MLEHADKELLIQCIAFSHDGIFITNRDGMVLYCNDAYLKISGMSKKKLIGKNLISLMKEKEIPDSCSLDAIKTKKTITKIITYYEGTAALITSTPILDKSSSILYIISNVRDVTELTNLRKQLQKSNSIQSQYKQQLLQMQQEGNEEPSFLAESRPMQKILQLATKVAQVHSPVLIQGESGVGKDMIARYIHKSASIEPRPFIHINCGAIPETLLESELFGYEAGAFTGAAIKGKPGLLEIADNGTLFLDEVGEMPISLQVKLLDVLQTNKLYRLGGTQIVKINARIIAATNVDLEQAVKDKRFRQDLYYRLNVFPINIPPLRERQEDIIPLIFHFLERKNKKFNMAKKISPKVVTQLIQYEWPGNIRELKNVIERMLLIAETDVIDETCLPQHIIKSTSLHYIWTPDYFESYKLKDILSKIEREVIKKALENFGSMRKAALFLDIDLSTLVRKKQKYNL